MTQLTTVLGNLDVAGGFPARIATVVANTTCDSGVELLMIDAPYRGPCNGNMARPTVIRAGNMPNTLPGCLRTVVASDAKRGRCRVIHDRRQTEPARRMAYVALLDCLDVPRMFATREAAVMAAAALARQPFEYAAQVTGFAREKLVATEQRETGGGVVEIFGRLNDGSVGGCREKKQGKECSCNCTHLEQPEESGPHQRHLQLPRSTHFLPFPGFACVKHRADLPTPPTETVRLLLRL